MFPFIRHSRKWFVLSMTAIVVSLSAIAIFGLNLGIDFTGGTLWEVKFGTPVTVEKLNETLTSVEELDLGQPVITPAGEDGRYILRFRYLDGEDQQAKLEAALSKNIGGFETERLTTVGPVIGKTLKERAIRALTYAAIAIILYIAATFRDHRRDKLTKYNVFGAFAAFFALWLETAESVTSLAIDPAVQRWGAFGVLLLTFLAFLYFEIRSRNPSLKYGVCAILALAHDIIITLGLLAILGVVLNVEINTLTITALLAIMGFSVNDTIVVFDRLRENLKYQRSTETFGDVADKSLNQTLARSVNTSVTTIITLATLFWLGAASIHWFIGALLAGTLVGTYSSIFIATPLLVVWQDRLTRG